MASKIQVRRDTANNWTTANPILADGERGYDKTSKRYKTGDGVTAWVALPFDRIDYADIDNTPTIPNVDNFVTDAELAATLGGYATDAELAAAVGTIDGGNAAG